MRQIWLGLVVWAGLAGPAAAAIEGDTITIGVLTDLTGGNATAAGQGSVVAAQLAAEEARASLPGIAINIISADHQNKADTASTIARDWMANRGVNVIADVPFSSAALAVNEAVRGAPRTVLVLSGPGASELTGAACSPNLAHWTYDSFALSNAVGRALVQQGGTSWFFITADYAFGAALERDATAAIKALGGRVIGSVKNPAFASDFSSYLLTAQSSGAEVIAFANSTIDLINLMKQAKEFGMGSAQQRLAGLLVLITDVESLGLQTAQGLFLASPYYWDFDDRSRAFAARFAARMNGAKPTLLQAGVYSGLVNIHSESDARLISAALGATICVERHDSGLNISACPAA